MNEKIELQLKSLVGEPGCYLMKNRHDKIIYVGKAKNLRSRVSSYFSGAHDYKTTKLVSEIDHFDIIVTNSEKEALILEINLIKEHRPKYNIMFMDDKSYPYIKLSGDEYPKIDVTREKKRDPNATYFGPYPDAKAAWQTFAFLNELLPLRKCKVMPKKVCLYYHLGQCLGPCEFDIDPEVSLAMKEKVKKILRGDISDVLEELTLSMNEASDNFQFEKAALYRDQIQSLKHVGAKQNVQVNDNIEADIINYALLNGYLCIVGLFFRNGQMLQKNMSIQPLEVNIEEAIQTFLVEYYAKNPIPKQIVVPVGFDEVLLSEVLETKVRSYQRGRYKQLLEMAYKNAQNEIENRFEHIKYQQDTLDDAMLQLSSLLDEVDLRTIDLIDVSHTAGSLPVGACVVFEDGQPVKSLYRRYKLNQGNNDVASMKEIVYRRYLRALKEQSVIADVLIVDGGLAQVNGVKEIIDALDVNIKVCGLVKDEYHNTSALINHELMEIKLDKRSPLYQLLAVMQDEIHRFAISYHRKLRTKKMTKSLLDDIVGLGSVRKSKLLKHFGSLKKIREASEKELMDVLGQKIGQSVYEQLKKLKE